MSKFKIGDMVIVTREPTDEEWGGIGEVEIPPEFYTIPQRVVEITQSRSIVLAHNIFGYPECCFELYEEKNNLLELAKKNYPIGTRVLSTITDNEFIVSDKPYTYGNDIYVTDNNLDAKTIYCNFTKSWAEIINDLTNNYKTNKKQQNDTESNKHSESSIKLQRVNLKIREGNPIRGIGLKSSGIKIKLRSNNSYN